MAIIRNIHLKLGKAMPRPSRARDPIDVITIVRDIDELNDIRITWNESGDPVVSVTYRVPLPDGTLGLETRTSSTNPTGFITSVFNDTE